MVFCSMDLSFQPYSYSLSFLAVNQSNGFHINKQSMRLSELCLLITNPHCNPMLGLSQLCQHNSSDGFRGARAAVAPTCQLRTYIQKDGCVVFILQKPWCCLHFVFLQHKTFRLLFFGGKTRQLAPPCLYVYYVGQLYHFTCTKSFKCKWLTKH